MVNQLEQRIRRAARTAFIVAAVFAFVMAAHPHPPRIPLQPADKVLHMIVFATLGVLGALGFAGRSVVQLFVGLTAFGALIELVQAIPVLHRDSQLSDLLADMVAALVAVVATRLILDWLARRRSG